MYDILTKDEMMKIFKCLRRIGYEEKIISGEKYYSDPNNKRTLVKMVEIAGKKDSYRLKYYTMGDDGKIKYVEYRTVKERNNQILEIFHDKEMVEERPFTEYEEFLSSKLLLIAYNELIKWDMEHVKGEEL